MTKDALIWGILFPAISYPFFMESYKYKKRTEINYFMQ